MFLTRTYKFDYAIRTMFRAFVFFGYIMSLTCLLLTFGKNSAGHILPYFMGAVFIGISAFAAQHKIFRLSPFALIFCYFTFLFFYMPICFLLFKGMEFSFSQQITDLPYSDADYFESLSSAFFFLTICWLAVWFGLVASLKVRKIEKPLFSRPDNLTSLIVIVFIVAVVSHIANEGVLSGSSLGLSIASIPQLLALIFFDHVVMVLVGMRCIGLVNRELPRSKQSHVLFIFEIIFLTFVVVYTLALSRAGVLHTAIFMVLFPISFYRLRFNGVENAKLIFFRPVTMGIICFAAPAIYVGTFLLRDMSTGQLSGDFFKNFELLYYYDFAGRIEHIFYRLVGGGLGSFILIFQDFVNPFDMAETRIDFLSYLAKNLSNLFLPGTVFPEAFYPTSQLLGQILQGIELNGRWGTNIWSDIFFKTLNTQPFTIYGLMLIFFSALAPIFLFLSAFLVQHLYMRITAPIFRLCLLYFFYCSLSCFAFEHVVINSATFFLSAYFLTTILRLRLKM